MLTWNNFDSIIQFPVITFGYEIYVQRIQLTCPAVSQNWRE